MINLIKTKILLLVFISTSFISLGQGNIQLDSIRTNDTLNVGESIIKHQDTMSLKQKVIVFERSLDQLSKLNYIKYKEQKELREKLTLSGQGLQSAKKSFFVGLSIQIVGLTSFYLINNYSPENYKTSNGILYVSTGINFACLINTWVKIGNSGKRLSEL